MLWQVWKWGAALHDKNMPLHTPAYFLMLPPIYGSSPSHLTEIAGPNQAQGERVEHEGFLDGDLLARYLKMPEMKQQVGHETSQRGGHRHHVMSTL